MKEKRTLEYYMSLPYKIEIIKDTDEEGYVAFIPELKGCITTGITEEDALENLKDAKATWLSSALDDGDPIPEPDVNDDTFCAVILDQFQLDCHKLLH